MNGFAQFGLQAIAALAILAGIVGCVIPVLPGPILAFFGLLCLLPTANPPSAAALVVFGALTAAVTAFDFIVPAIGAKTFDCSKSGVWGCNIGMVAGLFFGPLGLLLGPFLGAFVGELLARKDVVSAAKGGLGAFLGFLSGVVVKVVACLMMLVYYLTCL